MRRTGIQLEDNPRSTPGHSKVLDQIGAIMELMILASRVGLTKKLLRCYVDVQKHLKQLLKDPKKLVLIHAPFAI